MRWRASDTITLGGSFRVYDNDGSYTLERDDYRAFAEYVFSSDYLLQVGYRSIDYDEDRFDDYSADILERAVGYRW